VSDSASLTGPSSRPPAAGGTDCAPGLAVGPKNWPKTQDHAATTAESTTSAYSILSPNGDNRGARGGGNRARTGGGCGGAVQNK